MTASRIAIDGPAGSGKTAVGSRLARELDYLFLDTGAMYRTLGLLATRLYMPTDRDDLLVALLKEHAIDVVPPTTSDGRIYTVLLDKEDVTDAIRQPEVGDAASRVAVHRSVRQRMVALQSEYGRTGSIVMVGRDIGTIVMPDADLKVLLTASVRERARRRLHDLLSTGKAATFEEVQREIAERDRRDEERAESPLRLAPGGIRVDSDDLSIDAVLDLLLQLTAAAGDGSTTPELTP